MTVNVTNGKEKVEFHAGAEVLASLNIGNIRVVPDYHHRCVCVYVFIACVCIHANTHKEAKKKNKKTKLGQTGVGVPWW